MRRLLQILGCSAALAAIGLLGTATALASGTGTSAGDQQYVDPLTTTTAPTTTTQASTPSTTQTSPSPSSSAASAGTTTSSTTSTTPSSASTARASSGTLPYTGLNVEASLALGLGLVGAGVALRRALARA